MKFHPFQAKHNKPQTAWLVRRYAAATKYPIKTPGQSSCSPAPSPGAVLSVTYIWSPADMSAMFDDVLYVQYSEKAMHLLALSLVH